MHSDPVIIQFLLHEGVVGKAQQAKLADEIRLIYARNFGTPAREISVDVTEIPKGRFFTAATPSRSSLIGGSVPKGTAKADRTRLMAEITEMWCEVTGCTADDVVVSMSDR